ncbi:MAG TPA: endonuclease/exonuclease/phosphatase family protein [Desertimonas sp.]|nr:endonuclease/exonuclease/phosphatase family protein [Desertimonas sp.]
MAVVEVLAWVAIALMAILLVTQAIGWSGARPIVGLQALTPYVLGPALPIAVIAASTGRWPLAAAAGAGFAALIVLGVPLRRPAGQSTTPSAPPALRVFHGNLLYHNGRTADLARAVAAVDADVLAFTEYTFTHAGGMYVSPLANTYPYRIEHPEATAGGSAIWSRYPLAEITAPPALYRSTAAVIEVSGGVELYVVHPPNPLDHLREWLAELIGLADLYGKPQLPTIVTGDFNATYWHPSFRRIQAAGWRDAHHVAGRAFTASWPSDRPRLPPVMRLDHALVDGALSVDDVADVDLPGSDHRGFVVTVSMTPPAAAN